MSNVKILFRVLKKSEEDRAETLRREKKRKKAERRRDLAGWVPWINEPVKTEENPEKPASAGEDPAARYWINLILGLLFCMAGAAGGMSRPETWQVILTCKVLFTAASLLILLQLFPSVCFHLYQDKNIPMYMTMPITAGEFLMAKFLQLAGRAYRIGGMLLLPVWLGLGFTMPGGPSLYLTEAVLLGVLIIPQFVLSLTFTAVILLYAYRRLVMPGRKLISILIPAAAAVLIILSAAAVEFLAEGNQIKAAAAVVWEVLNFNYALGRIIQGEQLLPLLLLLLSNALAWMVFALAGSRLYKTTLIRRKYFGKPVFTVEDLPKIKKKRKHSPGAALFLREIREVRGMKVYRISTLVSSVLAPAVLVLLYMAAELVIIRLMGGTLSPERRLTGVLVRYCLPLSFIPSWMNRTAATAFSRDSRSLEKFLVLPAAWEDVLRKKILASICSCAVGAVPGTAVLWFWLWKTMGRIPWWGIFPMLALAGAVSAGIGETAVLNDIRGPLENWGSYKEMVMISRSKGRGIIPAAAAAFFFLAGLCMELPGESPWIAAILPALVLMAAALAHLYRFDRALEELKKTGKEKEKKKTLGEKTGILLKRNLAKIKKQSGKFRKNRAFSDTE